MDYGNIFKNIKLFAKHVKEGIPVTQLYWTDIRIPIAHPSGPTTRMKDTTMHST
jgi:hypothetical protein